MPPRTAARLTLRAYSVGSRTDGPRSPPVTRSFRRARFAARWPALTGAAALAVTALGCATTWDEVTSRERDYREIFWVKPDPLETIKTTTDGERRGKALAR